MIAPGCPFGKNQALSHQDENPRPHKLVAAQVNPAGTLRPVTPRDIAVLVRTGDHAKALASELRARGIDVSLSTPGLIAIPECQLALACLRVLVDPRDSLAAAEVIALEARHPPETWLSDRLSYPHK